MSKDSVKLLNNIQYFLSSILAICFMIGIFPFLYKKVVGVVAVCLGIQVLISIFRGRLLNVFFEIFLVGLAAISLVPVLGLVTSFFAMFVCILEMAAFKNGVLYAQMDSRAFKSKKGSKSRAKKSPEIKKPDVKFEDADFSEK
jgi:hypothetical protein